MTPWELRDGLAFVFAEALPHPELARLQALTADFSRHWHALWAQYGSTGVGKPIFRSAARSFGSALATYKGRMPLRNGVDLTMALQSLVLGPSVID